MNKVQVLEVAAKYPYIVQVNGELLRDKVGRVRYFKTSIKAATAGAMAIRPGRNSAKGKKERL